MSTTTAVPDKKGVVSSLSADAAEFVPLAAPGSEGVTAKGELTSDKRGAPPSVQVRDVPKFLTSCFPFVQLDGELRNDAGNQYPLPLQFQGLPHTVPMPSPGPVRLPPAWQGIRPELIGGFPPQPAFGSLPFMDPLAAAVSLASERPQGEGLLPTPVGLPLPGLHNSPGLILAAQPGHMANSPWLLTSAPPPLVPPPPQQQHQQQQHPVFLHSQQQLQQQQPSLVSIPSTTKTTVSTCSSSVPSTATSSTQATQMTASCAVDNRASSPIYISRSAQTNLPKQIHNFTLKEKPHPLYARSVSGHKQRASNEQDQDSDSGYSSPLQAKKFVSCGTQVFAAVLSSHSVNIDTQEVHLSASIKSGGGKAAQRPQGSKEEDSAGEAKKKTKKKKDQRAVSVRSPHSLGSSSKLLSRSSSSISSAGTRPEDDDEKVDLHSWTDFPPMTPKSGGGMVGRPPLTPTLVEGQTDRVALTIERTAHAPPWTIKYTGGSGNGSSRSSSGEKEKSGGLVTSSSVAASTQLETGPGQGSKQSKGATVVGQELLKLITNSSVNSGLPPSVHKSNMTCTAASSLTSSHVASTVTAAATTTTTTTMSRSPNTSVVTTFQASKGEGKCRGSILSINLSNKTKFRNASLLIFAENSKFDQFS
ncbi:hypothetical protein ElyMa_005665400 [Elysia marginata]|uniref:AXH domain-containing protein n=1 Tax=Elysia marginata TaxID=1093978 RepID=A0AAV4FCG2_9GAST|nr:hypothetical protein ElyMa_005665400 [Elysia marginata]